MHTRKKIRLTFLSLAVTLAGCSAQSVAISETTLPPEPLVEKLPLRVGIKYTPEMADFTHKEELLANRQWTVSLGDANKRLYQQIFASMFDEAIELAEGQDPATAGVDIVVVTSIEAFEFALPQQSRSEAYTVWIRYRLTVYDELGKEMATWPVNAYGKAGAERFNKDAAFQRAASLAMRDAAALVSLRFAKETGILEPPTPDQELETDQLAAADTRDTSAGNDTTKVKGTDKLPTSVEGAENFTNDQG